MMKKPTRKASKNMIKVFLFLFSISYLLTSLGFCRSKLHSLCAISIYILKTPFFFFCMAGHKGRLCTGFGSPAFLAARFRHFSVQS